MKTKEKIVTSIPEVTTSVIVVPAVDVDYYRRSRLSGNPLLKSNAGSRIYANDRVNGTTSILLAIIAGVTGIVERARIVTVEEFKTAFSELKNTAFKSENWKRLEKAYKTIGGNSSSPDKKIGPVVTGLIREGKLGNISGFDPAAIGSEDSRKALGYSY